MDYKKLKEKIISAYGQIQIFFEKEGESLDFTEGGFYQAVKNESLKINKLEDISKKIGVPMSYWWADDEVGKVGDFNQLYFQKLVDNLEKIIRNNEKQLEEKEQTINELKADKHRLLI